MDNTFDPTKNEAKVFRASVNTVLGLYEDHIFTDVTFTWLGEFYGCRFTGIADIEVERRQFMARRLKIKCP